MPIGRNGVETLCLGQLCRGLDTLGGLLELCRVPRDNNDIRAFARKDAGCAETGALGATG